MAYMVKSEIPFLLLCATPDLCPPFPSSSTRAELPVDPGLMPGFHSLVNGDIPSKRRMTKALLKGFYRSTFFPDPKGGPFAADAIISNPPAFAHVHVAEALGLPLHMSFSEGLLVNNAWS
jgi:sterol 3beta-glucosyltransferase